MPTPTRITRTRRPVEVPAEPVKIIETSEDTVTEKEADIEKTARAASGRTDYEAVIKRFNDNITNRRTAIRSHCVECMGGMVYEVAKCTATDCSLFQYRMGEDPNDARTIAAKERREAAAKPVEPTKPARVTRRPRSK